MEYRWVPHACLPSLYPMMVRIAGNGVYRSGRAGRPHCTAQGGNVAAERRTKTPKGQKRPHRRALRATNPFKTRVTPIFSRKL